MLVIILKFLEVGSRAVFVVLTSYSLEIEQAGQFGLVVTLQGLASFAAGYERHIDVMRCNAGQLPGVFDTAVSRALSLFGVNYVIGIPLFVGSLMLMTHLPPVLIGLCIIIAIAEQLMNFTYCMAMVESRYRPMLVITVIKNVVIAGVVSVSASQTGLDLPFVLVIWALASVVGIATIGFLWLLVRHHMPDSETLRDALVRQYRASWTHFLLGLTAVLTIQIDRLMVGALLSLSDAGVYFRHILLVSMMYQLFNIAFYNRILPRIFAQGRDGHITLLVDIVRREYRNVLFFWALGAISFICLHVLTGGFLADRYNLQPVYFMGLLAMSAVRARADLNALVFNALHKEGIVFRLQLLSFVLSLPVLIMLTYVYGIPGLIIGAGISAVLYLTMTALRLLRMTSATTHAA